MEKFSETEALEFRSQYLAKVAERLRDDLNALALVDHLAAHSISQTAEEFGVVQASVVDSSKGLPPCMDRFMPMGRGGQPRNWGGIPDLDELTEEALLKAFGANPVALAK